MSPLPLTAFFFATPTEAHWLKTQLHLRSHILFFPNCFYLGHRKSHPDQPLLIVETGVGLKAASQAAGLAFSHFQVREALLLGVAAAARPELRRGEAILALEVGGVEALEKRWRPDGGLLERARRVLARDGGTFQEGPILSLDRIVHSPDEKIQIGHETGAMALEMEGASLAQEAEARGVSFLEIRWILDPTNSPLPLLDDWVDQRGTPRSAALTRAIFKRPKLLWELPALGLQMSRALRPMKGFLQKWFAESP